MSDPVYRVARGVIRKPRTADRQPFSRPDDFFQQGAVLPKDVFPQGELLGLLAAGIIEEVPAEEGLEAPKEICKPRGPWQCNPESLVGKSLEELLLMIHGIDEDFLNTNEVPDIETAVQVLTTDWDPRYAQTVAPVTDRSKPEALRATQLEQFEDGTGATSSVVQELSQQTSENLEKIRARAAGKPTE